MGFEVDFLPVGEGEKSGDAIALRFGNLMSGRREDFSVAVIDAGFKDSGQAVVDHIQTYYKTDLVDLAVSTHPDADHINGLSVLLENMKVGTLWMHQPWKHTRDIAEMFKDGRVTDNSVKEDLRESLNAACDLETLARRKKVPIVEPFTGTVDASNSLYVLGPTQDYYESLLPEFRGTPESKLSILESILKSIEKVEEAARTVFETFAFETLNDGGQTSAENNTSVLLMLVNGDDHLLFTADAGIPALMRVMHSLDSISFDYSKISFIQVPHHGSQRNIGPLLLNRFIGPKLNHDTTIKTAFASVAKEGAPKHPCKKVMNAFRRRGAPVHVTQGQAKRQHRDAPARLGWTTSTPLPFYPMVEI